MKMPLGALRKPRRAVSEGGLRSRVTLRAPEMSQDSGVPFAAYIHPSNPSKGAYGGFSFVIFPAEDAPCLVGMVVGTQGLAPDQAILGRPGHARKAQAICTWLNAEFGKGKQVAWAKQDPTRIDIDISAELQRQWSVYKLVFERYGKVLYALFKPSSDEESRGKLSRPSWICALRNEGSKSTPNTGTIRRRFEPSGLAI